MENEVFNLYITELFRFFDKGQPWALPDGWEKDLMLALNESVVRNIHERLGLMLLRDNTFSNSCFATANKEIRDEYKQFISPREFLYFLYGTFLISTEENKSITELFWPDILPEDSSIFWERLRHGEKRLLIAP